MPASSARTRRGFTLIEIIIILAIMALFAAILIPNYLRMRRLNHAQETRDELHILNRALIQYAMDTKRPAGFSPHFTDLQNYMRENTHLYKSGADSLGDLYGPFTVDSVPKVPQHAEDIYSDVTGTEYWSPYNN